MQIFDFLPGTSIYHDPPPPQTTNFEKLFFDLPQFSKNCPNSFKFMQFSAKFRYFSSHFPTPQFIMTPPYNYGSESILTGFIIFYNILLLRKYFFNFLPSDQANATIITLSYDVKYTHTFVEFYIHLILFHKNIF